MTAAVIRRQVSAPSWSQSAASWLMHTRYRSRVSRRENRTLAVEITLTPILAWVAKLRVKVAIDGSDIDRRGCRAAHCSRVRICRRAWRRRYSAGAGGRNCAAVRGAIPPAAAATAPASAGETASPALSGPWRLFFLHLSFATRKPLNHLASANAAKVLMGWTAPAPGIDVP